MASGTGRAVSGRGGGTDQACSIVQCPMSSVECPILRGRPLSVSFPQTLAVSCTTRPWSIDTCMLDVCEGVCEERRLRR